MTASTEKTPLVKKESSIFDEVYDAYSLGPHATFVKPEPILRPDFENLVDYEPAKLSSFRVFCISKGTILGDPVLFVEQLLITLIFSMTAVPVWVYFREELRENRNGDDVSVRRWIVEQEGKMRAFAMIMTNLAAFLLSFYTAICVARWWAMRTGGIGGIKAATVDIELLLFQNVTKEEKVLSAIRRYGRVSLMLVFLWRRGELGDMKEFFVTRNLLEEHEADQLLKWNHCLHETIWAWQAGIITMLHKEGKIKSDQLYSVLLQKCTEGRQAVQLVHTHLAVRVPMQYVHLLGLLVKMHNLLLALIMGGLFGAALRNRQIIICVQLFARTLILPFLFNAILLINADLADPFSGGPTDFPGLMYQAGLEKDCNGLVAASKNMPDWLEARANFA